jgi:hypothetical protein
MFFNVGLYRKEVFADEVRGLLIFIRLGVQPSTRPSRRSRAEIQQNNTGLLFRGGKRLIDILAPIYSHKLVSLKKCIASFALLVNLDN